MLLKSQRLLPCSLHISIMNQLYIILTLELNVMETAIIKIFGLLEEDKERYDKSLSWLSKLLLGNGTYFCSHLRKEHQI